MRLIDFFDQAAARHPERCAFADQNTAFGYAQMRAFSQRLAAAMRERGVRDYARVGVYSPNSAVAFGCILAIARVGAVYVPINIRNAMGENADFIALTECEWLFYESSFHENVVVIRSKVSSLTQLICIDKADGDNPSVDDLIARRDDCAVPEIAHDPHRMVTLFGTGGTTGRSKAVRWDNLTWETLIAQAAMNIMPVGHDTAPVHLCVAPMTHAAGVLAMMLLPFAPTNIVLDRASPLEILEAIDRYRVTHLYVPPTLLYSMLAHPRICEFNYGSLTHFIVAAAPVAPDKLARAVGIFGPCMCQYYGQAEAPMAVSYFAPYELAEAVRDPVKRHRLLSCGRPNVLSRTAIADDHGSRLPAGTPGELLVQGNLVSPGYFRDPKATAAAQRCGWLHTGDIAQMDEDGFLYIVDRKKDMIISGGFNVYSVEVEATVNGHPAVENCAVVGVPDSKWGESVKAIVVLRPNTHALEQEIIEFCKAALGSVKAPKSVEFWPDLPRTPVGKVAKSEIRARYWAGRQRAVN
jgi:acyl-CoA synthetase (AMP-forming)/AMP-acid ligase II